MNLTGEKLMTFTVEVGPPVTVGEVLRQSWSAPVEMP